jgi:hypothetical protein
LDLINRKILTALNDFLNLHYLKNLDTFDWYLTIESIPKLYSFFYDWLSEKSEDDIVQFNGGICPLIDEINLFIDKRKAFIQDQNINVANVRRQVMLDSLLHK